MYVRLFSNALWGKNERWKEEDGKFTRFKVCKINLVFMKYSSFSCTIATLVELYLWRYYGEERSAGGFEYFFETNNFLRMKYFAE